MMSCFSESYSHSKNRQKGLKWATDIVTSKSAKDSY